jgi:hypothetical protein
VKDARTSRFKDLSILDWDIGPLETRVEPLALPTGQKIAGYVGEFEAKRRIGFYIYQFIIPMAFIVFMSWAAFWVSPDQFGVRQGVAITSMLTLIAYRFILVGKLPRVAYLTRCDYLVLGCTTLVFLVLVEVVVVHRLVANGRELQARRIDAWSRGLFPLGYALLAFTIIWGRVIGL